MYKLKEMIKSLSNELSVTLKEIDSLKLDVQIMQNFRSYNIFNNNIYNNKKTENKNKENGKQIKSEGINKMFLSKNNKKIIRISENTEKVQEKKKENG